MKVSPSIISAKLDNLATEILQCESAGVYSYHLDVMDGHFVPNLTMGPDLVKAIRRNTRKKLEAHLMIDRPDRYYSSFLEAGADILLVHAECLVDFRKLHSDIISNGGDFGIVINPETPLDYAIPYLEDARVLLIMSVHPGFSGQKFIPATVDKVRRARQYINENKLNVEIEVDGGINNETGALCAEAGADILVSASYIFSGDISERVGILKKIGS